MSKRKRPCRHTRRIKTKKGIKKILINPHIKNRAAIFPRAKHDVSREFVNRLNTAKGDVLVHKTKDNTYLIGILAGKGKPILEATTPHELDVVLNQINFRFRGKPIPDKKLRKLKEAFK